MQENDKFFQKIEKQSYTNYLQSIILHRVFQSEDQKQKWEHLHKDYKRGFLNKNQCKKLGIESILGAGQTSAWKVDTLGFIQYSQTLLIRQNRYLTESFNPESGEKTGLFFAKDSELRIINGSCIYHFLSSRRNITGAIIQ